MTEAEYIRVSNYAKLTAVCTLLRDVLPGDDFGIDENVRNTLVIAASKAANNVAPVDDVVSIPELKKIVLSLTDEAIAYKDDRYYKGIIAIINALRAIVVYKDARALIDECFTQKDLTTDENRRLDRLFDNGRLIGTKLFIEKADYVKSQFVYATSADEEGDECEHDVSLHVDMNKDPHRGIIACLMEELKDEYSNLKWDR